MAHSRPSSVRELLNDAVRYFYFARKVPAASSALLWREIFLSVVVHTRELTQTAKTHIKVLVFRTIMSYRSNIAYRGIRIWARNTLRRIKWLNGEFFKRQKSARPNIKQRMFRDTEWKHRIDLITHFKRFVCIFIVAEISRSTLRSRPQTTSSPPFVALLCLDFHPVFYLHEFKLRRAAFRSFRPDEDPIALGRWDKRQADKFHFALFFTAFRFPDISPRRRPTHPRWMILLDYTITADRLCLTFGPARKWDSRLPTSSDLCYVCDDISRARAQNTSYRESGCR